MKILLVEDSIELGPLHRRFLEDRGHMVTWATDGSDGLFRYQNSGPFDMVITDLHMPVKDGVWMTQRIRNDNSHLPIIGCTGALPDELAQLKKAGATVIYDKMEFSKLVEDMRL